MPKQTYKIQGFHGGISSDTDPRDIQDIESPSLVDANIDSVGRVKTLGSVGRTDTGHALLGISNQGLFVYGSDRQLDDGVADEEFIVVFDDTGNNFDIKDSESFTAAKITASANNFFDSENIVYYANDGVLRIGDGDFHGTTGIYNNQWFGFIDGNKFSGLNANTGTLARPEITQVVCVADASDSLNLKYFDIYGATGKTLIWINTDNTGGASAPSGSGSYDLTIEVEEVETDDSAEAVAIAVASAVGDHANFSTKVVGETIIITDAANAGRSDPSAGDSGFIVTTAQDGASSGTTTDIGWYSNKQDVESPFGGICIISNPEIGSDGNTVNSTNAEYDGSVAASSQAMTTSSVNMRVGLQYQELFPNTASVWTSTVGVDSLADDVATYYPLIGDNNVKIDVQTHVATSNEAEDTGLNYSIDEENTFIFGVYMKESEFAKIERIEILCADGSSNYLQWKFDRKLFETDCWNYLVCSIDNITTNSGYTFGENLSIWTLKVYDKDDSDPDVWVSGPVLSKNPGLTGFQEGSYTFHYTWLYDEEKQESLPSKFWEKASAVGLTGSEGTHPNKINVVGGSVLFNFDIYTVPVDASANYGISKRISGSRIYWKLEDNDNLFLIGELDFVENGFKWLPEGDLMAYSMANSSHSGDGYLAKAALVKGITPISANTIDTYKSINGFSSSTKSITAKYKTAVVHGRRTYIGNIRQITKKYYSSSWTYEDFPDRIIKSEINKFDVFPNKVNAIDVVINDGESIVKLEAFADRILQFKQNSMYVINVSENVEFLEDTYRNKGCSFPYHVTKTDFGIAWFNSFGVFFYDGKQVTNLLEKNGMRLIRESDWFDFIKGSFTDATCDYNNDPTIAHGDDDGKIKVGVYVSGSVSDSSDIPSGAYVSSVASDTSFELSASTANANHTDETLTFEDKDAIYSHIGYIPKKRQIIINNQIGDVHIYDFVLRAWMKGSAKIPVTTKRSNFALKDQELIYITQNADTTSDVDIAQWNPNPAVSDTFVYETKDIDFGEPGVRKKIYKVYLSFKGNAANVQVHYGVDGLAPALTFNSITSGTDGSSTGSGSLAKCIAYDAGTTDWLKAELKPSASINNKSSFRLKVSGDGSADIASDFEINDISIIYRMKSIR